MRFLKYDYHILSVNILQHLAGSIYLFQAPFIASILMPNFNDYSQLMIIYGIFASSMITKPLGSFIAGYIAAKYTPNLAITVSSFGKSISLIAIALIPSTEIIGDYSIFLLLISKLFSGLFASSFSSIAKIILLEGKSGKSSMKASYYYPLSSSFGALIASLISIYFIYDFRIIFLLIGVIIFVLSIFLSKLKPLSRKVAEKYSVKEIFAVFFANISKNLTIIFLTSLSYITWYVPFVLVNSIIEKANKINFSELMFFNSLIMSIDLFLVPLIGKMISRGKYINIMKMSAFILSVLFILTLPNLENFTLIQVNIFKILVVIFGIFFFCPHHYYFKKLYEDFGDKKYIYIGTSISIGAGVLGKTVPFISLYLASFGSYIYTAIFFSLISVFSCVLIGLNNVEKK